MHKFTRLGNRLVGTRTVVVTVALLFLCIWLYSILSIHVLSVGDWPHDVLKPVYGDSWIQAGWASSLDLAPMDRLDRFDVIVIDSSAQDYASTEPWSRRFEQYVEAGGTMISVVSKDTSSTGQIYGTVESGRGKRIEVGAFPDPAYRSSDWELSRLFWEDIFKGSVSSARLLLLQSFRIAVYLLGTLLALQSITLWFRRSRATSAEEVAEPQFATSLEPPSNRWKSVVTFAERNRHHFLIVLILLSLSTLTYVGWIKGIVKDQMPAFEEGLSDASIITYYANYMSDFHQLPRVLDSQTYSQPMDISYYVRTPVVAAPALLTVLGFSAPTSMVISFVLFTFAAMLAVYVIVDRFTRQATTSLFAAILYIAANSVLLAAIVHGHMRILPTILLTPLLFLATNYVWDRRRSVSIAGITASILFYFWFLGVNAVVATICISSAIIMWSCIFGVRLHIRRLGVLCALVLSCVVAYLIVTSSNRAFLPNPAFSIGSISWQETPNMIQALALNVAQATRLSPILTSVGATPCYALIAFLPVILAALAPLVKRQFTMPLLLGLLLVVLATGFYGPFAPVYEHIPLVFRSWGRTLLPVATFIFCFLGCLGFSRLVDYSQAGAAALVKRFRMSQTLPVVLSCIVLLASTPVFSQSVRTWHIPLEVEQAYDSIPRGSRVLLLPIYGESSYGYALNSPASVAYRPDSAVGWSILHLDEYEAATHGLKSAYSPLSTWEVPLMTQAFFDLVDTKMVQQGDVVGAIQLLDYAPDLQYLVVYRKIIPDEVMSQMQTSSLLQKHFENDLMVVYKRTDSVVPPIVEADKAFLLYTDDYGEGLASAACLRRGASPLLMGQAPWGNVSLDRVADLSNVTVVLAGVDLDAIAAEYASNGSADEGRRLELEQLVSGRDFMAIYELERSASSMMNAAISDDWRSDWVLHPSGGSSVMVRSVGFARTTIQAPVDGEYYVTLKTIGTADATLDRRPLVTIVDNALADSWQYSTSRVSLTKGAHDLIIFNLDSAQLWVDCAYLSSAPIAEITKHQETSVDVRAVNDATYKATSDSDQLRYVLLMKSYFPNWRLSSKGASSAPFLANGFLTAYSTDSNSYKVYFDWP